MDTYIVKFNGTEVLRVTGEGLECAKRGDEPDLKCIKKVVNGQSLFVLMSSTQKNVSVERFDG